MPNPSPERIAGKLPPGLAQKLAELAQAPDTAEVELLGTRSRDIGKLVRAGVVSVPRGRLITAIDLEITEFGWDVIGACADLEME